MCNKAVRASCVSVRYVTRTVAVLVLSSCVQCTNLTMPTTRSDAHSTCWHLAVGSRYLSRTVPDGDDHGPDTESERCGVMDMPHAPSHAPPRSMHTHLTRPAPPARLTFFLARHRARGDFGGQRRRYLDTHDRCAATSRHKSFTDRFTAHTYTTHRSLVKTSRWLTLHTLYKPARASSDTSQLRYEPAQRRASSETRQLRDAPAQRRASSDTSQLRYARGLR